MSFAFLCKYLGHAWQPKSYSQNGNAAYWHCPRCGQYHYWNDERMHNPNVNGGQ
jgi:hypothetical protein